MIGVTRSDNVGLHCAPRDQDMAQSTENHTNAEDNVCTLNCLKLMIVVYCLFAQRESHDIVLLWHTKISQPDFLVVFSLFYGVTYLQCLSELRCLRPQGNSKKETF